MNARALTLDEATSAPDTGTGREVRTAFQVFYTGKTVDHRPP